MNNHSVVAYPSLAKNLANTFNSLTTTHINKRLSSRAIITQDS
ncbi:MULTISPECIES: hypothetical protein [Campylobacter]|uniref:Uncharacterized protein n=1 Tax=Campylobacter porcelli TaxID=1660073 RepID=A0ABU7M466_9BACT|nr:MULTISPECIES: hypothetical protein [unclassified Campylobacter]MCR8678747.1 hypothetical protein [Campylobacter sp. RM19072]MCR8696292.1 hypothetical protein [Campylobacter sp. RM19073]MEE3704544.1 hypothetical protein [Campylobacter sp. CX2-8023-23]MEE3744230.1 hypothetical protein [Campylobacter sp. CX2-4855-23]MEE3776509.1 hypothetical protein [Campylobacter sp. CX2-4080-23]